MRRACFTLRATSAASWRACSTLSGVMGAEIGRVLVSVEG